MLAVSVMDQPREYWVGWGTLALINAGLAQGKNRSGLVWFLVSVFLGPIATLILLFMPKRTGPTARRFGA
ncbi:MAG TPA: hypothetical protein VG711_02420 [Phycisphaerales bacterium]|nr:hypothetical protein [Phycisphaerales bacterium]